MLQVDNLPITAPTYSDVSFVPIIESTHCFSCTRYLHMHKYACNFYFD